MKWIDPSSFVSWFCYAAGLSFEFRFKPLLFASPGAAFVIMAGAIAAFFIIVMAMQRYMGIPLLSRSFGAPKSLITTGPFSWTRNPIYLAFLIPLLALAWVSAGAAACTIGIYITAMNVLVIKYEERSLLQTYGDEYRAYLATTPRWVAI